MVGQPVDWRRPLALAALLIGTTLLVYAQTWRFDYVLIDDPIEVSANPRVQAGLTLQNVVWCFSSFFDGNWIPFTWLSLMLDTTVFGFRPGGYHFTNVLLHVADTVLLFAFLARATGHQLRSAFVAALFALHPLHVESVAWITERKDVLSTLFGFVSLLAYVRYAKSGRSWALAACFVSFVASLLSKPTLVTLPFLLLLLDYWPLDRWTASVNAVGKLLLEKVPFVAVSAVFAVITVRAQASAGGVRTLEAFPLSVRSANAVVAYAAYLGKTLFPRDLMVYYPHPGAELAWSTVAEAAVLLLAISAVAVAGIRRCPYLFVGWAWYLGTLLPMIGIVQVGGQQMADRYTYFPLIGFFIALVWLVCDFVPAGLLQARVLPAVAVCTLAALAWATFVQAGYWQDDMSLFGHSPAATKNNAYMLNKFGVALVQRGKLNEAIENFEAAIRRKPRSFDPQYNLALVLQKIGRLDEAAQHYRTALALNEQHADAHNNLGAILLDQGKYAEAKQQFQRAAEINPNRVEAHINLGALCLKTREYAEAITQNQRALAINPRLVQCRRNIVAALLAQGRSDEAVSQLELILRDAPGDEEARAELARILPRRPGR